MLPLIWKPLFSIERFYVSESNREAWLLLEQPVVPVNMLCIHGPAFSGKSHMAHIWSEKHGAHYMKLPHVYTHSGVTHYVLDHAHHGPEHWHEEKLLEFLKEIQECGHSCVWLARTPPRTWSVSLPDVLSRLRSMICVTIGNPDDKLLYHILKKRLEDVGICVDEKIIMFLMRRMPRSYGAIEHVIHMVKHYPHMVFSIPHIRYLLRSLENGYVV